VELAMLELKIQLLEMQMHRQLVNRCQIGSFFNLCLRIVAKPAFPGLTRGNWLIESDQTGKLLVKELSR